MSIPILDPRIAINSYSDNPTQKKLQIDELKKHIEGGQNKDKQLREACEGFEAIFVQQIWEQMRKGVPKSGLMESRDQEMYQSLFDVELSKKMASAGGIGLADMLFEQLNAKLGKASRATSPGILKGNQVMKELNDLGQGIELKPYYGSLKTDPETELAQRRAESVPGSLYEELKEEGLEYINPYSVPGRTAPIVEEAGSETKEELQADKDNSGTMPGPKEWQQKVSSAFHAYVGTMNQDINSVGSIGASKNNIQQDKTQEGQTSGVKIINPMDPESLMEIMVNKARGADLANNMQAAVSSAMEVPGFSGMKPPFAGNFISTSAQQMSPSINPTNLLNSPVSVNGPGQMPKPGMTFGVEVEGNIIPGSIMTSPTGVNQPTNEQSELSSIPDGMFMRFDNIPDI